MKAFSKSRMSVFMRVLPVNVVVVVAMSAAWSNGLGRTPSFRNTKCPVDLVPF